jgi:cytochrome c-type biogenesis protein CcmH/NrfG
VLRQQWVVDGSVASGTGCRPFECSLARHRERQGISVDGEIMRTLRKAAFLLLFTLAATGALAQARGEGRVSGKVVDDKGQPVQDVQVKATMTGQPLPVQTKSNKKGEWTINGIAGGEWNLEFSKDGFDPQNGKVTVDENNRMGDITVKLAKHTEKVDPGAELTAKAQEGMNLLNAQKFAEARKIFEDLLVKFPDVHQLNAYIAQSYAGENNLPKAVEYMRIASDKDPTNEEMRLVLADLIMEQGDKPAALEMMKKIDITKVKNPLPFINASITLINESKTDEALEMLNKVITQFPTQAEGYYYRGRAYVAAKKYPEAKADLEKFVSMAPPDAREVPDAKKILEQIKDAK